jgi:spore maturation protein CgeB
MLEHFSKLKKSNLKCGIFVNKNLTHEQENHVLCNSKVALNIHDAYQKTLGLDSNERTFKSLGLTGALVCDNIAQVKNEFDNVQFYDDSSQIIDCINKFLQMSNEELKKIKEINKNFILNNHTYINRVDTLKGL